MARAGVKYSMLPVSSDTRVMPRVRASASRKSTSQLRVVEGMAALCGSGGREVGEVVDEEVDQVRGVHVCPGEVEVHGVILQPGGFATVSSATSVALASTARPKLSAAQSRLDRGGFFGPPEPEETRC